MAETSRKEWGLGDLDGTHKNNLLVVVPLSNRARASYGA